MLQAQKRAASGPSRPALVEAKGITDNLARLIREAAGRVNCSGLPERQQRCRIIRLFRGS